MTRLAIIVLIILGVSLIVAQFFKERSQCDKPKIVYRYIPRTFNQEYDDPIPVTKIFEKMFVNPSPWMANINTYDRKKVQEINKFFISQM